MITVKSSALAILGMSAIAFAQAQQPRLSNPVSADGSAPRQHQMGMTGATDPKTFVSKAAQGGLTEVAASKLAAAQAQDSKIRDFAEHMIKDHSKANDELTSIARKKGLEVPSSLDAEHQAIIDKLKSKSGTDFDKAYSKQMETDHKKTVALFESATKSSDPDLAGFAQKTLPTLQEHKEMADKLPGAMRSAKAGTSTSPQ